MEELIVTLAQKAAAASDKDEALKFSQAALNLANIQAVQNNLK